VHVQPPVIVELVKNDLRQHIAEVENDPGVDRVLTDGTHELLSAFLAAVNSGNVCVTAFVNDNHKVNSLHRNTSFLLAIGRVLETPTRLTPCLHLQPIVTLAFFALHALAAFGLVFNNLAFERRRGGSKPASLLSFCHLVAQAADDTLLFSRILRNRVSSRGCKAAMLSDFFLQHRETIQFSESAT
jgi:hypothetical protein